MTQANEPRLPSSNDFSPGQIVLKKVLQIAHDHSGKREEITEEIRKAYYADAAETVVDPQTRLERQRGRANNVCIGMAAYGLLDFDTFQLTQLGKDVLAAADDAARTDKFAAHILQNLHGRGVLDAIRSLQARRTKVTKERLIAELDGMGFRTQQGKTIPENTTDHLILLKWLREAKVLDKYTIDEDVFARLAGITAQEEKEIANLSRAQRAFLRVMKDFSEIHGKNPIPAKTVKDHCVLQYPGLLKGDRLADQVLDPLEAGGWLTRPDAGGQGRGAKSGKVAATDKLIGLNPEYLKAERSGGIPPEVRDKLNTPLEEIVRDLASEDTHVKGLALEVLSVRLAYELGLTPLRFRERGRETQGAEVDLIAEGIHLHFSRWVFQCKNTRTVSLAALAKEIGMAVLLKAHVIVLVTTGRFAETVREHADGLAETTPLQVVLIDGEILKQYQERGAGYLVHHFRTTAEGTMRLKRRQVTSEEEQPGAEAPAAEPSH